MWWVPVLPARQSYQLNLHSGNDRCTFSIEPDGTVYESSLQGLDPESDDWRETLSKQTFRRPDGSSFTLDKVPFGSYVPSPEMEDNPMAMFLDSAGLVTLESHVFPDGTSTLIDPELGYGFHLDRDMKVIGDAMCMEDLLPEEINVPCRTLAEPSGDVYFLMSNNLDPRTTCSLRLMKLSPRAKPQVWPIPSRYMPTSRTTGIPLLARCGSTILWYAEHLGCIVAVSVRDPFDLQSGLILNELRLTDPPRGTACRLWLKEKKIYLVPDNILPMRQPSDYVTMYWLSL
jgi:hypothetical protein